MSKLPDPATFTFNPPVPKSLAELEEHNRRTRETLIAMNSSPCASCGKVIHDSEAIVKTTGGTKRHDLGLDAGGNRHSLTEDVPPTTRRLCLSCYTNGGTKRVDAPAVEPPKRRTDFRAATKWDSEVEAVERAHRVTEVLCTRPEIVTNEVFSMNFAVAYVPPSIFWVVGDSELVDPPVFKKHRADNPLAFRG